MNRNAFKTRAAFIVKPGGPWIWLTWDHNDPNKHGAILDKAKEIGAVGWDFSQAYHDFADRFRH